MVNSIFPTAAAFQKEFEKLSEQERAELFRAAEAAFLPFPPKRLNIGITSRCNFNCPFCFNHVSDAFDYVRLENLDYESFCFLVRQFHRTEVIGFEVMGETLLHPRALDMMDYATRHIPKIALTTNGSLLSKRIADKIASLPMEEIFFSCDASDGDTYEQMRVNGSFSTFLRHISYLSGKTTARLNFNAIVFAHNLDSLLKLPKLASENGIGRIQFVPPNETPEARERGYHAPTLSSMRAFIPEIIEQCRQYGIEYQFVMALIPPGLAEDSLTVDFSEACMMPFDSMTVDPFGRINFCCYLEWITPYNAFQTSARELWNCWEVRLLRAGILTGLFPGVCRRYCHRRRGFRADWERLWRMITPPHHINWRVIHKNELIAELGSFVLWPAGKVTKELLSSDRFWNNREGVHLKGVVDKNRPKDKGLSGIPVYRPHELPDLEPDAVVITSDTFTKEILMEAVELERPFKIFRVREDGTALVWHQEAVPRQ